MEEQSKRVKSKGDKWGLIDEKIYHLRGARPKTKGKQGLPPIWPNLNEEKQRNLAAPFRGDRHFQPKSKCTLRSPQELISVDNVSLVTARKGNKLPYCRTDSTPLPRRSPSKIFPSRVSPSRMPFSAPAQMSSAFQWPSMPELPNSENNHVASESAQNSLLGMTTRENNKDVHLPCKPQHHGPFRKTVKSHFDPTLMELDERKDAVKKGPSLLEGHESEDLLERPKLRPVSSQNSASSVSFALRKSIKSEDGQNKSYPERNINRQHRDLPRRSRFSRMDSTGPDTASFEQVLCGGLEEEDLEEVFLSLAPATGSRAPEEVSRQLQKATNFLGTAADKEKNQRNMTVISETDSKQGISNGIGPRPTSPVSFVTQLIANPQTLTLKDSIESPALQKRKKLARALRKNV